MHQNMQHNVLEHTPSLISKQSQTLCVYAQVSLLSPMYISCQNVCICAKRVLSLNHICAPRACLRLCVSVFHFFCILCFPSVCLSSGPSLVRAPHVRVLYAQHNVVVGAGARVLAQQSPRLQQCGLARHRHVGCAPRLAVVSGQTDAHGAGAVPHQLLRPAETSRTHQDEVYCPLRRTFVLVISAY